MVTLFLNSANGERGENMGEVSNMNPNVSSRELAEEFNRMRDAGEKVTVTEEFETYSHRTNRCYLATRTHHRKPQVVDNSPVVRLGGCLRHVRATSYQYGGKTFYCDFRV